MSGNDFYPCPTCGKVGFQGWACDCQKTEVERERDEYRALLQRIYGWYGVEFGKAGMMTLIEEALEKYGKE